MFFLKERMLNNLICFLKKVRKRTLQKSEKKKKKKKEKSYVGAGENLSNNYFIFFI